MTDVQDRTFEEPIDSKEDALRKAKQAIAGPVPMIPEAGDNKITLPLGLFVSGVHKTELVVRELTGVDEELLSKQKEPADFFDAVIGMGTVSADDYDLSTRPLAERQGVLRTLLIGERDQLFIAITRATFGNEREIGFSCGVCGEKQEVTLLLDVDFVPKQVEDLSNEVRLFVTSKGDRVSYRLVNGEDQREAITRKGATMVEQNSTVLSRVITKVNDELVVDPLSYARSLPIKDRNELLGLLVNSQPSISLEVTTNCAVCGATQPISLGWADLFRN